MYLSFLENFVFSRSEDSKSLFTTKNSQLLSIWVLVSSIFCFLLRFCLDGCQIFSFYLQNLLISQFSVFHLLSLCFFWLSSSEPCYSSLLLCSVVYNLLSTLATRYLSTHIFFIFKSSVWFFSNLLSSFRKSLLAC